MDADDAVFEFDASVFGADGYAAGGPDDAGPRKALPPPKAASPAALYARLQQELNFAEGPDLLRTLEGWNADLFSCMPAHRSFYASPLLSSRPGEVIDHMDDEVPGDRADVDLLSGGAVPLPEVPATEDELPAYVAGVQAHFVAELAAREESYASLLLGYCRALLRYIRSAVRRGRGDESALAAKLEEAVRAKYYREVMRLARLLLLHLYLDLCRRVSWRLHSAQLGAQSLFVSLRYQWTQDRQITCLFHPILFNHGVVLLRERPLDAEALRHVNFYRQALGLPLIRAGLVETGSGPLFEAPPFSADRPRSLGFLTQQIRAKLEAYSAARARPGERVEAEHAYARRADGVNYGTTPEAMLDPPSPSAVLPGDPTPAADVDVAATGSDLQIPEGVTLEGLESSGYTLSGAGVTYDELLGDTLNKILNM
ncbi:transactivating tegument protein VP16 [Beluga whale alphaherpesvirus 1]|uniref:Tegument protein VP16 homolog n=1 Tax=Beluga whale alphaherpesvirus 1 TaxID=1434720 RepID=A0A286RUG2_9ALPH|nr:transactivating tegument protein VP16 [Beluga whale alphaherpesvirus 1]ASW27058.1 transactivating tegument protein VP16 [Beluga whale alphaherpesvirus 1]